MKTIKLTWLPFVARALCMAAMLVSLSVRGDRVLEGPVARPAFGTFWSLSHGTAWPPAPCLPALFEDAPIYAIVGSPGHYVYDDSENPTHTSLFSASEESSLEPSIDPPSPPPLQGFGTNLWITITNFTGSAIPLGILNTTNGLPYEVLSATNILTPLSNWVSECIVVGLPTNTPAFAEMGSRTNQLFFRARQWDGNFTYGVPTNGQLFLQVQSSPIYPVINGVTNTLSTFYGNWVMILPTNLLTVNLGYDANDGGITNAWITTNAQQGVLRLAGFSKTLTNLCISYNPITNLNVSGWPALKSVDAWHCTNNLSVSVTNCPQLARTCFEAIQFDGTHGLVGTLDYSGCPKIAEVRAADNRLSDVTFANGAGPEVWHLCIHDNSANFPPFMDFTHFPSMKELWIWDNQFYSALNIPNSVSTNLLSVEAFGNHFPSADFSGQTNLDHILLSDNLNLTNLNIFGCSATLNLVNARDDGLSMAAVDSVLNALDAAGRSGGQVLLQGGTNSYPSADGYRHALNLLNKTWSVTINLPPSGTPQVSSVNTTPVSTNSTTVTWTTDVASDSTVYYSTTTSSYSSANDGANVTNHSVTLTGLSSYTLYHFYVNSTASGRTGTGADSTFITLGNTNAIWFTNVSQTVAMQVSAPGGNVTWYWGDGSSSTGTNASHTFSSAGSYSNAVIIDPPDKLLGFGVSCGNTYYVSNTILRSVCGLSNYPKLGSLYLLSTYLTDMSLAGCSNLTHAALIHTAPSSITENGWLHQIVTAQVAGKPTCTVTPVCDGSGSCNFFYCPATPGFTNTAAGSDYWKMGQLNWTVYPAD